jgi:hypothetical protein
MKNAGKYTIVTLLLVQQLCAAAQQYEYPYKAGNASISYNSKKAKGEQPINMALVTLPESSSQITLTMYVPDSVLERVSNKEINAPSPKTSIKISFDIDRDAIQQTLTSSKTFSALATITINNISKETAISFTPLIAGTEEDGNFNLSAAITFKPSDFNLVQPVTDAQLMIRLTDAPVNRL